MHKSFPGLHTSLALVSARINAIKLREQEVVAMIPAMQWNASYSSSRGMNVSTRLSMHGLLHERPLSIKYVDWFGLGYHMCHILYYI